MKTRFTHSLCPLYPLNDSATIFPAHRPDFTPVLFSLLSDNKKRSPGLRPRDIITQNREETMAIITTQLINRYTDTIKSPDFDILAEGETLSGVAERLMSLSLTDNRGFEADQLTITPTMQTGNYSCRRGEHV